MYLVARVEENLNLRLNTASAFVYAFVLRFCGLLAVITFDQYILLLSF